MHKTGTEVTVIECDTIIQRIYEYNGKLEDISVKGRGGTEF
jgi:predicted metal-dependent peptidase